MPFGSKLLLSSALWATIASPLAAADNVTFTDSALPNACDADSKADPEFGPPFNSTGSTGVGAGFGDAPGTTFIVTAGLRDTRDASSNKGTQRVSTYLSAPVDELDSSKAGGDVLFCAYQLDPSTAKARNDNDTKMDSPDWKDECEDILSDDCRNYLGKFDMEFKLTPDGGCPDLDKDGSHCGGKILATSLTASNFSKDPCEDNQLPGKNKTANSPDYRTASLYGITFDDTDDSLDAKDMYTKHMHQPIPIFVGAVLKPSNGSNASVQALTLCITPSSVNDTSTSVAPNLPLDRTMLATALLATMVTAFAL